ncbi:hypothetical protein LPJ53_001668 [Coemansia erecta]|uniref:Uncharacterized protein n=1 Tax=Coemansia erecta TaxID=147472 RepID=A0A9W8CTU3_9FUNG|nr:hypothetical protein LPJ53_001668 [Coemansia erecta]
MIHNDDTLHFAPHPADTPASCLQGVARSQSMTMPSRHPGLMDRLEPVVEHVSGFRASHGSEFTAIPDADTSTDEEHLCGEYDDASESSDTDDIIRAYLDRCDDTDSDDMSGPRASYSPSQRTLRAAESYLDGYVGSVKADTDQAECPPMTMSELDIFDSLSRSVRRPHSERFPDRVEVTGSDLVFYHRDDLDMFPELSNGQRAMYIRTSCADSDLVKSTFDLAKLLPSAPR